MNPMPPDFAKAAKRHHSDADHLHGDNRLHNADQLYGLSAECALKFLAMKFLGARMTAQPGSKHPTRPAQKPWFPHPVTNKPVDLPHLPWSKEKQQLLVTGRQAGPLLSLFGKLTAFDTWSVEARYGDGTELSGQDIAQRRTVAKEILEIQQRAAITGRL